MKNFAQTTLLALTLISPSSWPLFTNIKIFLYNNREIALCILLLFIYIIALAIFSDPLLLMDPMADPMPGVRCPSCLERGIEEWVLPGKHCPRCATAC